MKRSGIEAEIPPEGNKAVRNRDLPEYQGPLGPVSPHIALEVSYVPIPVRQDPAAH
jgi:hypothetical protein